MSNKIWGSKQAPHEYTIWTNNKWNLLVAPWTYPSMLLLSQYAESSLQKILHIYGEKNGRRVSYKLSKDACPAMQLHVQQV